MGLVNIVGSRSLRSAKRVWPDGLPDSGVSRNDLLLAAQGFTANTVVAMVEQA